MKPLLSTAFAAAALGSPALAQLPVFQTPGMPNWSSSSQVDRFTNSGNPALGALLDGFADFTDDGTDEDGFDLYLRSVEMTLNGRIDPNWWGYAVVVYADEEVELEESAVTYGGFDSNTTLRFGRFFVDFGKQMQAHIHDLPYPDRPGVLAAYLGEELPGVGAQVDHWWATGDESALRASVGVFGELGELEHGEEEGGGPEPFTPERSDAGELGFSARLTQFMDAGERGVFQWGLSARHLGRFGFADDGTGSIIDDLANTAIGLDLTYGVDSEDGLSGWTFGGELLHLTGDLDAEFDALSSTFSVLDDGATGFYGWGERRFDQQNSLGLLLGSYERPEPGLPETREITGYYTRYFSEFSRLRLAVSNFGRDEEADETQVALQLTTFFGPHAHGVNW